MKNQKNYKAFTLIEILVSLIIIGIVATTLPLMLQTGVKTAKNSAMEEIFYQEFSLLQLINTMYFDENNTIGDNYYKDLNATGGDSELYIEKNATLGKYVGEYNRVGKFELNNNILRSGTNATVSSIGPDGEVSSEYDDVDDFNGYEDNVTTSFGVIPLRVSVKYISDEANYSSDNITFDINYSKKANFTNIKLITVSANVNNIDINLSYPSMNIGASKFLSLEEIER